MPQAFHESGRGVDDAFIDRSNVDCFPLLCGRQPVWIDLQDQLGNLVRVEVELETQVRRGLTGLCNLRGDRQSYGNTIMRDASYS